MGNFFCKPFRRFDSCGSPTVANPILILFFLCQMIVFMPTAGDVIIDSTDPSLAVELNTFPEDTAILSIPNFVVGIAVVHESVASFAGRYILTAFPLRRRHLNLSQKLLYSDSQPVERAQ